MVAELVAQGRSNREIAQTLGISSFTVKTHVTNVMMKWNCAQTEVAVEAVRRLGLEDDNGPGAVD